MLTASGARNEEYEKRFHARAKASIETIKRFELLDVTKLDNGVYAGSAIGYEGPVEVAATVSSGRLEKIEITKHKEKQYYSALLVHLGGSSYDFPGWLVLPLERFGHGSIVVFDEIEDLRV